MTTTLVQRLQMARNDAMARARAEKARVDAGYPPPLTGGRSDERIEANVQMARGINHMLVRLLRPRML